MHDKKANEITNKNELSLEKEMLISRLQQENSEI
jgi:hypothetical protein